MLELTELAIRAAKPKDRPYKLRDGGGLFLFVRPDAALYWRFRYRYEGREKLISLGVYPHVSLKAARARRDEARLALTNGIDPAAKRRAERVAQADSFEAIAQEWISKRPDADPGTVKRDYDRLRKFIYPYLGKRPI